MTLNNAHSSHRGQANIIVDDPSRFNLSMWLDPTIQKFVPMGHFEKPLWDNRRLEIGGQWKQCWEPAAMKVGDCPNVIGYRRNEKFHAPRWLYEDTINWGNHTKYGGGRSVMLAGLRVLFLLGFRRVYLLGVDFEMTPEKRYHFAEGRTPQAIRNNMSTYAKLQEWFAELQPYFLQEHFIVKNCNPRSKLTGFPYIPYEDAIAEATVHLGDYTRERTAGMYEKLEEKMKSSPSAKSNGQPPAEIAKENSRKIAPNGRSVSKMESRILDPLLAALAKAELGNDPFCHLWMEPVFPEDLYREMLGNLPDDCHYQELRHRDAIQANGRSSRLQFRLDPGDIQNLPAGRKEFWQRIGGTLRSPHLEQSYRRALDAGLARRFGKERNAVAIEPRPILLRDIEGYKIGIHTDITPKVITAQFYLPRDASQENVGTTFYRKNGGAEKFEVAKRLPFRPNSGYAFAVTDHSFHGVDAISKNDGIRNSLILTYYLRK